MINIYNTMTRNRLPVDPCREMLDAMDEQPPLKAIVFISGVAQQLTNLGVLDAEQKIATVSSECLPCWWRLFHSGYRPDDVQKAAYRKVCLMDADATEAGVDTFFFWYDRYIHPDFFGARDLRPNERN